MFGDLPKIFDRNFTLSYFFPSTLAIILAGYFFQRAGITHKLLPYLNGELVNDLSAIAIFSYLGGIILLILNRVLYRFLEGYGALNPFRLVSRFEKKRYRKLIQDIDRLDNDYGRPTFTEKDRMIRTKLMLKLSSRFPDQEPLVLPTSFGNIIRSFEVYPRVMYGIEYIDSWSRLQAVMPTDFRSLVDNAKAETDLWINIQFITTLLIIQLGWLSTFSPMPALLLWLAGLILLNLISAAQANSSAVEWGDYAKSSFDIFVPKLREALGFPAAANRDSEREQWVRFSQAIIFRLPYIMPESQRNNRYTTMSYREHVAKRRTNMRRR